MHFHTKTLLIALFYLLGQSLHAQPMRYGIIAGLQQSHPKDHAAMPGFHIGMKGEYSFTHEDSGAYIDVAAIISAKGWKDHILNLGRGEDKDIPWNCHLYYLQMPIHIGYKTPVSDRVSIIADAGPYFAIGLYGKSKFDTDDDDFKSEIPNEYSENLFTNGTYKRFDMGVGAKIGIEIDHKVQIHIGYDLSIINPSKERWKALLRKDRTASVSVAYMLKHKAK